MGSIKVEVEENNKGADQPAHPRSLISIIVIRSLEIILSRLATGKISIYSVQKILLCRNKSSTEFMLSASDKRRYIKRLIFLVSVAEQAGYTTLLETLKTDFLALQPIN